VHFGNEPIYSNVLEAWLSAHGRELVVSDDRAGRQRWPTDVEQKTGRLDVQVARAQHEAQRAQAEAASLAAEKAAVELRLAQLQAEREATLPPMLRSKK
jgi:hypothetical protein